MPARYMRFRAITDEFRTLVDRRNAWPTYEAIKRVAKPKGGKNQYINLLRDGGTVPEKFVIALAELLRNKPVMAEYLTLHGIDDPAQLTTDEIVDRIAGAIQSHADPVGREDDWHRKGIDGLSSLFKDFVFHQHLTPPESRCKSEGDVRAAVVMIMATAGRQVAGDMSLAAEDAITVAERHMRIGRDDYLGLILDRWRAVPWVLHFGVTNRQRVGCSLILPLKDEVYDAIYRGERDIRSCTSAELCQPSRMLFVEAVGHRDDKEIPDFEAKTIHTAQAIYVQLAALTLDADFGPNPPLQPLNILSMAGNPINEERLKQTGFRPTGTKLAGFDIRLMRLEEDNGWFLSPIVSKLQEKRLASGEGF